MEESRIDPYQIVGFLLLIACAFYVFNMSPQPVENINENNSENQIEKCQPPTQNVYLYIPQGPSYAGKILNKKPPSI